MHCFHCRVSCKDKIVDFNLLAILLYILPTRVGKICAYAFLIHVHSSSFIRCSFSQTMYDHKHIPFVLMFGDKGYNIPHYA
jgi:hypothetical protein